MTGRFRGRGTVTLAGDAPRRNRRVHRHAVGPLGSKARAAAALSAAADLDHATREGAYALAMRNWRTTG